MINTSIISVEEYTDILIECQRVEILTEGKEDEGGKKMLSELRNHMGLISDLIDEAKLAKSKGHFEKAKHDFEKVLAELEVMKRIIKETKSSKFEVYWRIIWRIAYAVISGILAVIGAITLGKAFKKGDLNKYNNVETATVIGGAAAVNTVVAVTTAKKSVDAHKKSKEREEAGDSKLGSKDEFKYAIIDDLEKTEKAVKAEIKFLDEAIKIDKQRQSNKTNE